MKRRPKANKTSVNMGRNTRLNKRDSASFMEYEKILLQFHPGPDKEQSSVKETSIT